MQIRSIARVRWSLRGVCHRDISPVPLFPTNQRTSENHWPPVASGGAASYVPSFHVLRPLSRQSCPCLVQMHRYTRTGDSLYYGRAQSVILHQWFDNRIFNKRLLLSGLFNNNHANQRVNNEFGWLLTASRHSGGEKKRCNIGEIS